MIYTVAARIKTTIMKNSTPSLTDSMARFRRRLERRVEQNSERIAIHESAHALYAHVYPSNKPFGVKFVRIGLRMNERFGAPRADYDTFGTCATKRRLATGTLLNDRRLAEQFLILALVGPAAEYQFIGRKRWSRCRELDGDSLRQALLAFHSEFCRAEYMSWLRRRAMLFVEGTQPAILALSKALLEKRALNAKEVNSIWTANQCPLVPMSAMNHTFGVAPDSTMSARAATSAS